MFDDLNFVILLDEYENFSAYQQRQVNTLLKFVPIGTTFRVGMRLEGFHTFDTISENEYIKEGRDYQSVVFEDVLIKNKGYQNFLSMVAAKRLEAVPLFRDKGFLEIASFLGKNPDLEKEAIDLLSKRKSRVAHFRLLRHARKPVSIDHATRLLSYPSNPLLEMLNILWVIRGRDPQDVAKAMRAFLKGESSPDAEKYRLDYIHKYKLSLMFLLCSVYKQKKKYYGLSTFTFLSSGIVGIFIELCRRAFQIAYFQDRDGLLGAGKISGDIQDMAAQDVSSMELQMINRIKEYGGLLYKFARNLSTVFRAYHIDIRLRYPETNQFALDVSSVKDPELNGAIRSALEWSIIQKKPYPQKSSAGAPRRDIFTINRVFAPAFQITYRTRGSHSEVYDENDLRDLMTSETVHPKLPVDEPETTQRELQMDLFEGGEEPDA